MRQDNRGFTLIELLIAIAVLSVMSGVLLHSFAMSRHFNAKARTDEVVTDAAEQTMEALKGTRLSGLADGQRIRLGGAAFSCGLITEPEEMFRLTEIVDETSGDPYLSGYLLQADVRWSPYSTPSDSTAPNNYQIPRIADVSSPRNIVLDYDTLTQKEELWNIYFNSQYGEEAEEDDNEDGGSGSSDGGESYDITDTKRYLYLKVSDDAAGNRLTVNAAVYYILPKYDTDNQGISVTKGNIKSYKGNHSFSLGKISRVIQPTNDDEKPRIYLFLPKHTITVSRPATAKEKKDTGSDTAAESYEVSFDGIYIDTGLHHTYECYVIPEDGSVSSINDTTAYSGMVIASGQNSTAISETQKSDSAGLEIYTFSTSEGAGAGSSRLDISSASARKRIYAVTVGVYKAKKNNGVWEKADANEKPVLELNSTIRE
jgi:prepilin-type N-terminal cleavage/methylation domain-containing protein